MRKGSQSEIPPIRLAKRWCLECGAARLDKTHQAVVTNAEGSLIWTAQLCLTFQGGDDDDVSGGITSGAWAMIRIQRLHRIYDVVLLAVPMSETLQRGGGAQDGVLLESLAPCHLTQPMAFSQQRQSISLAWAAPSITELNCVWW